jgi:hypothetical protein
VSRVLVRRSIGAAVSVLMVSAVSSAKAQDCASAPLLGGRAAAGLAVAHSSGESDAGASIAAGIGAGLRASGAYRAARIDDVDRLRHEARLELSRPFSLGWIGLCPVAGASYGRLSTDRSGSQGQVTTRESWAGAEIGRVVALPHALAMTPFLQPMLVRRAVSWRSTDAGWIVVDDATATSAQLWLGLSLATRRNAAIARFRPAAGGRSGELELGVVTSFRGR